MGRSKDFNSNEYENETKRRLLTKIKVDDSDCWIWFGGDNGRYPIIRYKRKNFFAHRLSFELFKNQKIGDKFVCHTCDKSLCINPDHLFLGSHKDNMKDASSKKRMAFGEKHYQCKLKNENIKEIQILAKCGLSQSQVCEIFGISQTDVSAILRKKNWKYSEKNVYHSDILIKLFNILLGEKKTYALLKFYDLVQDSFNVDQHTKSKSFSSGTKTFSSRSPTFIC